MTADEVTQLIATGLPEAEVRVLTDDDTHFEAIVVAASSRAGARCSATSWCTEPSVHSWAARSTRSPSRRTRRTSGGRPGGAN